MSSFDLDPVESATLQENALRDSILPTDIPADFFQGAGTGLWNGLKSGDYRVKAEQAFRDTPEELAKRYEVINSLKPDPKTIGFLGQIGFGLGEFTAVAGENLLSGDVVPTLLSKGVAGTYEKTGTELNVLEGMDRATAANVAKTEAIFQGLGVVAPAAVPGKLAMRAGSGAAIQVGMGAAERASMAYQLNQAGYPEMAAQYKVFDTAALLTDAILGGGVAAIGGNHAERPGSFRENTNPNQVDALLTMNQAAHIETGTAPGLPITPESRQAHVDAHAKAMEDLINGNPVDVGTRVTEAEFLPHPDMDAARLEIGQALAEHIRGIADQTFIELENLKSMARERGLQIDEPLSGSDLNMPDDHITKQIEQHLSTEFGSDANRLLDAGKVKIVNSVKDLPAANVPDDVKGMYHNGVSYLVANNVSKSELRGLVLHEVGVHAGMKDMLGDNLYSKLLDSVKSSQDAAFVKARKAAEELAAKPEHVPEETLAYLVENHKDHKIVKQLIAAVRQWIYRTTGGKLVNLTDADIASMAVASLRRHARQAEADANGSTLLYSRKQQTESPEFNRWFGDSKVVDDQGKPLVVYHGTTKDFSSFDPEKSKTTGVFFSADTEYANIVAELDGAREGGARVMPAYVSLKNPMFVKSREFSRADTKRAKDSGFDGLITLDDAGKISQVTAFNSTQIKSATGNTGAFDPNNADIRYSRKQSDRKAGEQFTAKGIIADKPDMTIASVDGSEIPATQAIQQADANIATAKTESKAFSVAVTCGLRG